MKIFVKAKPRAKENKVEKIDESNFIIFVKAAPIEGKANSPKKNGFRELVPNIPWRGFI